VNHFQPIRARRVATILTDPVLYRWRRFLRFSVGGLIVLVLAIGIGLSLIVQPAHLQRDAVAAIKRARGEVWYDWQWSGGKSIPGGDPSGPRWLVNLIGVDYFSHVIMAVLHAPNDVTLEEAGLFSRLEFLRASGPSVSDAGLAHLDGLTRLEQLYLSNGRVTGAGMVHLKELTKLKSLFLDGTQVTDAGTNELTRPAGFGCPSRSRGNQRATGLTPCWVGNSRDPVALCPCTKGLQPKSTRPSPFPPARRA
jgi:hypothetical protein